VTPRDDHGIDAARIARAREAGADHVRRTPVLSSRTLSERCGGTVALKAENLQRIGSFKLRGALAKLAALGDRCAGGVVAGSAGNHAQAVAYAARVRGVPCEVFMPIDASISKTEAVRGIGATVTLVKGGVDDAVAAARERATSGEAAFVHPFDDPDIIAGQATLGEELVEDVADLRTVIVPVGGGGLASGVALAVKAARPDVQIVGVQAAACAPLGPSLESGAPVEAGSALTIADGIAVKRPGELTLAILRDHLDDLVTVEEDAIAEAMAVLLERAKLVVEGAGAVGVAAILQGDIVPTGDGTTVAILSGGNVDAGLLAVVARRHETQAGRRLVLLTRVPDRPGALAALLDCVARTGANLVEVTHVREGLDLHVRETAIELVLETRGAQHAEVVLQKLSAAGYDAKRLV
jgi:threonine dehydratase